MNKHFNNWRTALTFSSLSKTAAAGALIAALSGCGGGSDMGTVSASLTDAPACGYDHVYVTVTSVGVNADASGQSSNWYNITLPSPKKIDLLSLTNGALESLGQTALPAGTYQQLRLMLVPNGHGSTTLNNSVVPSGQTAEVALTTPSAVQTGIKLNTRQPFTVAPGTLVDLVLDFNACKSIVTTGRSNGGQGASGYLLKPVVTAVPQVVSGSIDGYVDLADATVTTTTNGVSTTTPGATVYAEQNGQIIRGTIADSNGHFVLSPLEQSSGAGPYDVVIVNGGKTSVIVNGVPVTAQANTALSTSTAPFTLAASTTGTVSGTVNVPAAAALDASQTINSASYVIATTNADSTTGDYSFTLPAAVPQIGTYATPLPIVLAPASTSAVPYVITATSSVTGTSASSQPITVTSGGSSTVDFSNLQ